MALPQRIATSAVELSKQVLNGRHVESDLSQLCASGKGVIDGNGNYAHLFGGEPSTPRTRRKLYKHEHEQFRSVKANDFNRNLDLDVDLDASRKDLKRQLEDVSPDMTGSLSPLPQDQRAFSMADERLFTYTYHKSSHSNQAPITSDLEATLDHHTSASTASMHTPSSAKERVQLISSHLQPITNTRSPDTRVLEFGLDFFLEECSHLRKVASETRREQEAVSRADMARLHGSRNFTHRVPTSLTRAAEVALHTDEEQAVRGEEEEVQKKDFECPFPHCHHILNSGAYWISTWGSTSDLGTLELSRSGSQGLMCVHDGCLECFQDGSEWRQHIMEPHHERVGEDAESLTVRMQRVWGKRRAVR
ncbi:Hypothetical protein D9617_6g093110 [Elsinoe fawcettii]|nr:Hypothetical protein D9617_6g093110 [Elsinoe fawcettii]